MPLIDIWEKSQESVLEMSIQQIVPIAGDGSLKDESKTSEELRHFYQKLIVNILEYMRNRFFQIRSLIVGWCCKT